MKLVYPAIALDHTNPVTNRNLIGNYLIKTFNQLGIETEIVFYKNEFIKYIFGLNYFYYKYLKNQNYLVSREPALLKYLCKKINKNINDSNADFVFAFGTNPVAFLETTKPIYIIADSTFNNLLNRYDDYYNLPTNLIDKTHKIEKNALNKAKRIFLSSKFAIDDAIQFYGISPHKLIQVPLGANIDTYPSDKEISSIIQSRMNTPLQLLMIGKQFHRKGIDIGLRIYNGIKQKISNSHLTIIGCEPPKLNLNEVTIIKNIDKSSSEGALLFEKILKKTHILLFPSRAEAFGHVISEANAYGIPVIANNVGGIPSAIDNGINGYLFDMLSDNGIKFAVDKISELYYDQSLYRELSINSYKTYSSKLNWNIIVKAIIETIEMTINE